jgi:hypothetical protein
VLSIVVAGALASKPENGGEAWVRLSWARGLRRLGHDVFFTEHAPAASARARDWFAAVTDELGFRDTSELVVDEASEALRERAATADLLVDISGNLSAAPVFESFRRRAYVDLDPGFTQVWNHEGLPGARLDRHHVHFTVGENVGRRGCPLPTGGFAWRPVRQPIVLADWPTAADADRSRLTTVATWRTPFGRVAYGGRGYGLKLDEFRRFAPVATAVTQTLEVALAIDESDAADRELLVRNGWAVVPAHVASSTPRAFQRYVRASGGEFSVAQGVYVETRCGWFSDRSVRYLASGRPVLVQDTGASVPTGEGVVTFRTPADAVAGAATLAADYDRHCLSARRLAEEYFDSDTVLARFLEDAIA